MKTDTQNKTATGKVNVEDNVKETTMKVVRKSLHPLQESARDKENLVGAGRVVCTTTTKDSKENLPKPLHKLADTGVGKIEKKKKQHPKTEKKAAEKKVITIEDLTSDAGPSEHYWETLAERRRGALERALKENEQLHEKISLLEQENEQYKCLLDEAKTVIETFQEIMDEQNQQ